MADTLNTTVDKFGNALISAGGEVNEKIEWAQGFIGKYANVLLTIVLVYALAKIFKIKIAI